MRILHLVGRSHRRGAELVALELGAELDELGHENLVVALAPALDGGTEDDLPALLDRDAPEKWRRFAYVRALRSLVDQRAPDVVLAHGGQAAQVAVMSLWNRRRTAIVWQRILDFPAELWKPGRRQYWGLIARRVDAVVALTADEAREMGALGFERPVWTIPNFREPSRFMNVDRPAARAELRSRIGIGEDVALIGFVGHLVHQKRPVRAVSVLEGVRREGVDAHLVMAGDGPQLRLVEGEIERRGLADHVTMLGHRDDVEEIFAGLDVVVLVSSTEGIPGVAIEAAMAGCPIVSYPVGGIREVVDHGRTGIVLDEPDIDAMAAEVAALLGDEGRRTAMSDAAREHGVHFSAERIANRYHEVLVAATTARRGSSAGRSSSFGSAIRRSGRG